MDTGVFQLLAGIPWAIPAVALALGAATVLAHPVGRRIGEEPWVAWSLLASIGLVVAVTLTPSAGDRGGPGCDLSVVLPTLGGLLTPNDRSLNVVLFIPLGLAVGGLRSRHRRAWLLVAIALAPLIELVQLVAFPLHRNCEATDILDNWLGLLIGLVAAQVAVWGWRHRPGAEGAP